MAIRGEISQAAYGPPARASPSIHPALAAGTRPFRIEPDLHFIATLTEQVGATFKKCMQCGTCSATCALSPDDRPFPRKEMIWAVWGMKDHLLTDPDIWLCYQCNDCSTRCPRGARPGDVLAAIRQQVIIHHATPRFLARWMNRARYVPLLLAIPAALLLLAAMNRNHLAAAFGIPGGLGDKVVFSYSSIFPHWLLNGFFLTFGSLVLVVSVRGVVRFWRGLRTAAAQAGEIMPVRGLGASFGAALKRILRHDDFPSCTSAASRSIAHIGVFFGFTALGMVTFWVITSGINPLILGEFLYPFGFFSPWKVLANLGGLALLLGCCLMFRDRRRESEYRGANTYFHWVFLGTLLSVVGTGFVTEMLHYLRLEPHRHVVYFVHLVLVFALLVYMPYSKFAHLIYRTAALTFAEWTGRTRASPAKSTGAENVISPGGRA